MTDDTSRVPKLRFPGFTGAWEQRKLGDFSAVRTGPFGSTLHASDYVNNGTPIITTEHFKSGMLPENGNGVPQVSGDDRMRLKGYTLEKGDIVFSRVGSVDINALVSATQQGWLFSGRVLRVRVIEQIRGLFLHYELSTARVKNDVVSRAVGQTMPSINTEILKATAVSLPNEMQEQEQLGAFFKSLDDLITLHQRKLSHLRQLKKGLLQKMFPKSGEDRPEVRFPGFADAWEQRKLSDLFIEGGSGGTPKSTNKAFYDGDIPFLGISDITKSNGFINNTEKHISSDGLNSSAAWIVSKGAISLTMYASVGKLAILNIDAATSQAFYNMIFDDYDLRDLVYQRLNKANELSEWNKLISTGTQSNLNADKVKNFQMYLPKNHDEIKLISTFFKQIDNTITLHRRNLSHLQQQKKALLQQMFV